MVQADFPEKLQFLFEPHRYKILYGGRGGAKSWGIARAFLIIGAERPIRVLCTRETQRSISDSVHKLLSDQIENLGFAHIYTVQNATIRGTNGTEFIFAGIRQNVKNLKSYEGCDYCWVEEAQTVSKSNWEVLIPTFRKENSEIWVSFNPELESDDTYKRFVLKPPPNAYVCKVGWRDNPWFGSVLKAEMEHLQDSDPDAYEHIYEGTCKQVVEGAIFRNELLAVDKERRITEVPYDAGRPVDTYWDLGIADHTSIWFGQSVGFQFRLVDFMDSSGQGLQWYVKQLQNKPYLYGTHWLPHDAQARQLGTGRTIQEQLQSYGLKVRIVPRVSVADRIAAARAIFGKCWFDAEKCADGLQALRHYRYEIKEKLQTLSSEPLHDWASHPADAFTYFGVAVKEQEQPTPQTPSRPVYRSAWM